MLRGPTTEEVLLFEAKNTPTMSLELNENGTPYIKCGNYAIRLETEELTDEMKEKARRELRETPEIVEQSLRELKKSLAGENLIVLWRKKFFVIFFNVATPVFPVAGVLN